MSNSDENRGIFFFTFFPIGLGIAYGLFGQGFIKFIPWWSEAFLASVVLAIAHVVVKSWKFQAYARGCIEKDSKLSVPLFLILQSIVIVAVIISLAFFIFLIKRLLA